MVSDDAVNDDSIKRVKAVLGKYKFFLCCRESADDSLIYVRILHCADLTQCDLSGPSGPSKHLARGGCRLPSRSFAARRMRWMKPIPLGEVAPQICRYQAELACKE